MIRSYLNKDSLSPANCSAARKADSDMGSASMALYSNPNVVDSSNNFLWSISLQEKDHQASELKFIITVKLGYIELGKYVTNTLF
jgi:hypothetical protein